MKTIAAIAPLALLLAACGSDGTSGPVSYSAPVGITFQAITSSQAASPPMSVAKGITTESGNPYGAFINTAKSRLGHDPSSVAVTSATLELLGSSTNVSALESVFTGAVSVAFDVKGTNTVYPVASISIASPVGPGPVQLAVAFDFASLAPADRTALIQGQFDVVVSGAPAAGFGALNAKADLQTILTFIAYQ